MYKRLRIFLVILCLSLINQAFSMTQEEMDQYTYIDFYDFISSYNIRNINLVKGAYEQKKIQIGNNGFTTYLEPVQKYATFLEYRGSPRSIDTYQKPFLLDWFKISNNSTNLITDDSAESILADENFGLFYTSTMYSIRGKTYFITTQKAVNDMMNKELKNGERIKVYLWNLGQYSTNLPVFIIVGFEKAPTITQAVQDKMYFREYFPILKDDIYNGRYDKAKGNIEILLKKYPNNADLRLNLCLIFNKTNFFAKSISCYKEVIKIDPKNYDAYYGVSMAYYNSKKSNIKENAKVIIENTTKALEIIQSIAPSPKGSLAMIAYNSFFLRAMAKISVKDKTALDDLMIVYRNQPTLVSSESIEYYKKQLEIDK